ncbi:TPM domain-containing protein [Thorsellia anophelis]|uniref:TPM domain-containing protein n=1 Tax=Thorsellia anophelis DSM 18579 TaxID=1123402 RepID=A0A1I0A1D7_9GAMM|nr:TPM domain-containing protein [Thorsellia anophelis]SES87486.1 uncharacterized protein SAMN02583745_00791 [Thorsellia anophelis DSM 18579]
MKRIILILVILCFSFSFSSLAHEIPSVTGNIRLIDEANVLSQQEKSTLNKLLLDFENQQADGSEFFVYIVNSTNNESIESYAEQVFNYWKIGSKNEDNGLLIIVAVDDRKVRIEVGIGYEGLVTDLIAGRIIRETLLPNFKTNDYYLGLQKGVVRTIRVINPEFIFDSQLNEMNQEEYNNEIEELSLSELITFPFLKVYLSVFIGLYCCMLFRHTKKLKNLILKEKMGYEYRKKSKDNKHTMKHAWNDHIQKLELLSQYKIHFPKFPNVVIVMIIGTFCALLTAQFIQNGDVQPIVIVLFIFIAIFINFFSVPLLFIGLFLLCKSYKEQSIKINSIITLSPKDSIFHALYYGNISTSYSRSSNSSRSSRSSSSFRSSRSSSRRSGGGSSRGGGSSGSW